MNKMQALHSFWSSFNIPAFDENSVPDEKERIDLYGAAFPYITYEVSCDDFGNKIASSASLWYRSSSWSEITAKEQEISTYITRGGRMIPYNDGAIWISKSTPWAQRMGDDSDNQIRRIVLNVEIEFLD